MAMALLSLAVLILVLGCSSPLQKAQKLFNEGKYEEVIAQYGSDPNVATVVTQAKEKLAEKMVADGKYAAVLELYPETAAAKAAMEKLAEQLFNEKKYAEVIAKYPETTWAVQAKAELDKQAAAAPEVVAKEKAAQTELDRIMKIKMAALRTKALKEFVANPKYAGTRAVAKAQQTLGK